MQDLTWNESLIELNVRAKTIKHLEENIGENLTGLGWLGKDFLNWIQKAWSLKEKNW